MTAQTTEPPEPTEPDDLDDLLPDDLKKGAARPLVRNPAQRKKAEKAAEKAAKAAELQAQSIRLAQIVNLHIAGYSLAAIGASIGATAEEVDRLLSQDTARYVRSQPALRTYVRNWISEKYMKMIDADWAEASNVNSREKLENQDRVMRMLDRMAKLHGAEAPTQTEVKVEAAPEAVEKLVNALASGQGLGYDVNIFDIPEKDIHEAVEVSTEATEVSGNALEQRQEGETDDGF